MTTARFDPGLQPERTALAWRRTSLALAVGALVSLRVLPPALGAAGVVAGLVGLCVSGLLRLLASRRSRAVERALSHPGRPLPGAALLLTLSGTIAVGALVGAVYVVHGAGFGG